jgi:hypothetical protein
MALALTSLEKGLSANLPCLRDFEVQALPSDLRLLRGFSPLSPLLQNVVNMI